MMPLTIVQLPLPDLTNFSYLVYCEESRKGIAVDPSFVPQVVLQAATELEVELLYLVNTHGHRDHIEGNRAVMTATGVQLAAHPADLPDADRQLADGDLIKIGNGSIEVLHTPGHSPGSIVLKTEDAVLTGDTLFVTRCGRADLPGSEVTQMYESLQRLKRLPAAMRVFPGHDYGPQPVSTIGQELEQNDYLRCPDLKSFIRLRMG
ncbi:MAG: MBL fold metallo-hydrolase [Desulfuromonadales bacterium]|nr:MBL fold metallo-hydrolase [Desulfuromonadales bacterium]